MWVKAWIEDDCAPDAETIEEACLRVIGEPFHHLNYWATIQGGLTDLGDADQLVVNVGGYTWKILSSYRGNSAIYRQEA